MDDVRIIQGYQYGLTVLHPVVIFVLLLTVVLVFALERRHVLVPVILAVLLIPDMQRFVLFGLDITAFRIVCFAALIRIVLTRTRPLRRLSALDAAFLLWVAAGVVFNVLQIGSADSLANRMGFALSALCAYVVVKSLVTLPEDIVLVYKTVAVVCLIVAVSMVIEIRLGHSIFAFLGGIPDASIVRIGRLRAQGPFSHPILAGTFGAVSFPFVAMLLARKGSRVIGALGAAGALIIVLASASSGPLMSLLISVIGLAAWPLRRHLRQVRHILVLALVGLSIVMKSPVWSLIGRIDLVGGSTGYHRFLLIDAFIRNFREWVFVGTDQAQFWGWGLQDITNQYVLEGLNGGLATLALFVTVIALSYLYLGRALKGSHSPSVGARLLWWAVGAQLLCHTITFLSVSYFDQSILMLYVTIALAAASRDMTPETVAGRFRAPSGGPELVRAG